jgi:hypothetical protein
MEENFGLIWKRICRTIETGRDHQFWRFERDSDVNHDKCSTQKAFSEILTHNFRRIGVAHSHFLREKQTELFRASLIFDSAPDRSLDPSLRDRGASPVEAVPSVRKTGQKCRNSKVPRKRLARHNTIKLMAQAPSTAFPKIKVTRASIPV